mgnify:CR=1 FL=1
MRGKDSIAGGIILIDLLILITINELQHDWILPALLIVLPVSLITGVWLFRREDKRFERKQKHKNLSRTHTIP